jgi:O-antigen/teichoic acid export membrane protein
VVKILSVGFIFIPFGSIPEALLVRGYEVVQLAKVAAITIVFYFSITLLLAVSGYSYTTMAWANLANIVVSGAAYRFFSLKPMPWMPSFKNWGEIAKFGFGSILTSLLKVLDSSLPDIFLGRVAGAASVGLYSRANATVNLVSIGVTPTINFFALPYLSGVHHRRLGIDAEFLRVSSIINSLLLPPLVWIGIMAPEIVQFLFGDQWLESVAVIPWICASVAVSTLFTLTIPALQGIGRPYIFALPLSLTVGIKFLAVLYLYSGTLVSFSQGILLGQLVVIPLYIYINWRYLGVDIRRWFLDVIFQLGIILLCGLSVWYLASTVLIEALVLAKMIMSALVFGFVYLLILAFTNLPIKLEMVNLFRAIKSRS